jgi:hypothetical protein
MPTASLFECIGDRVLITLGIHVWLSGITDHLPFAMIVDFCHANFDITDVPELLDEGNVRLTARDTHVEQNGQRWPRQTV